jgi:hypothetical protein
MSADNLDGNASNVRRTPKSLLDLFVNKNNDINIHHLVG